MSEEHSLNTITAFNVQGTWFDYKFKIVLVRGTAFLSVTGSREILRYSLLRSGTTFTSVKAENIQFI
jgi:hypothetical protein